MSFKEQIKSSTPLFREKILFLVHYVVPSHQVVCWPMANVMVRESSTNISHGRFSVNRSAPNTIYWSPRAGFSKTQWQRWPIFYSSLFVPVNFIQMKCQMWTDKACEKRGNIVPICMFNHWHWFSYTDRWILGCKYLIIRTWLFCEILYSWIAYTRKILNF